MRRRPRQLSATPRLRCRDRELEVIIAAKKNEARAKAVDVDGVEVGRVEASLDTGPDMGEDEEPLPKGAWAVTWSEVDASLRRCGVGTKLYEAAAQTAFKQGASMFCSDVNLSDMSFGFWEKQTNKGRAEWVGDRRCLLNAKHAKDLSGLASRRRRKR